LSVQTVLRGSNNLRVGRKMATFQLFYQSGRAKDLSALLYVPFSVPLLLDYPWHSLLLCYTYSSFGEMKL